MPSNIFLKVPGARGTSEQSNKKGFIDVLTWKWGMRLPSDGQADAVSKGRAAVDDIEITKYHDGASADLMKFCCGGTQFAEGKDVILIMTKSKDQKEVDFLTLKLEGAVITEVSFNGGDQTNADRLTETVKLRFRKFTYEYQAEGDSAGTADLVYNIKECTIG